MKAKDLDKSFDNNENIVSHLNTAKARCIIGLFQNKNVEVANINTLKPFTEDYFEQVAGILKTKGKLSRALLRQRAQEKRLEERL